MVVLFNLLVSRLPPRQYILFFLALPLSFFLYRTRPCNSLPRSLLISREQRYVRVCRQTPVTTHYFVDFAGPCQVVSSATGERARFCFTRDLIIVKRPGDRQTRHNDREFFSISVRESIRSCASAPPLIVLATNVNNTLSSVGRNVNARDAVVLTSCFPRRPVFGCVLRFYERTDAGAKPGTI